MAQDQILLPSLERTGRHNWSPGCNEVKLEDSAPSTQMHCSDLALAHHIQPLYVTAAPEKTRKRTQVQESIRLKPWLCPTFCTTTMYVTHYTTLHEQHAVTVGCFIRSSMLLEACFDHCVASSQLSYEGSLTYSFIHLRKDNFSDLSPLLDCCP
jgi:hypothetical protein